MTFNQHQALARTIAELREQLAKYINRGDLMMAEMIGAHLRSALIQQASLAKGGK